MQAQQQPPVATPAPAAAAAATTTTAASITAASLPIASLYVGDLSNEVTEAMLFEKFSQIGPVLSIRVCRDVVTRRSLGYAYVNFQNPTDAEKAIDSLNFEPIKGEKPMRIMWTQRDPSLRKSGVGNIFIKNLDKSIDNKALCDTFAAFGKILSCKIALDDKGKSLGYGFVHYEKQESADQSISALNGKLLNDKQVFVGPFIPKKERDRATEGKRKFTNLYVKHIKDEVTDDELKEMFEEYGPISSVYLQRDCDGKSKRFGFVSFEDPEDANKAMDAMLKRDEHPFAQDGKKLYIAPAKKKAERQAELRDKFEKIKQERANRYQGVNLYIKNLDDDVDDAELRKTFEQYGTVTSAKVMMTENEVSRGFGFVCFSSPEEATKAVTEMNGRIMKSKPLYVALAQRKEERQVQLSQMYNQRSIPGVRLGPGQVAAPTLYQASAGNFFLPPGASMGQIRGQFFPQLAGNNVRPTPRWPASAAQMRPGAQPSANNFMNQQFRQSAPPRASLNQPNIRGAGIPNTGRMQQMPGQVIRMPMGASNVVNMVGGMGQMPQGVVVGPQSNAMQGQPRASMKYAPNARNVPNSMNDVPNNLRPAGGPKSRISLDSPNMVNLPPNKHKQHLGEHLYPIVVTLQGNDLAGRITGMLLELENSDLIEMLNSYNEGGEDLKTKVDEAVAVIKAHAAKEAVTAVTRVAIDDGRPANN